MLKSPQVEKVENLGSNVICHLIWAFCPDQDVLGCEKLSIILELKVRLWPVLDFCSWSQAKDLWTPIYKYALLLQYWSPEWIQISRLLLQHEKDILSWSLEKNNTIVMWRWVEAFNDHLRVKFGLWRRSIIEIPFPSAIVCPEIWASFCIRESSVFIRDFCKNSLSAFILSWNDKNNQINKSIGARRWIFWNS